MAVLEAGGVGGVWLSAVLQYCSGAWRHVNTLTGSQSGGGGHSLLSPLSLHHKASPSYHGQHVSQLCVLFVVMIDDCSI